MSRRETRPGLELAARHRARYIVDQYLPNDPAQMTRSHPVNSWPYRYSYTDDQLALASLNTKLVVA